MKSLFTILFMAVSLTVPPGVRAGVQGTLPPLSAVADYVEGVIDLSQGTLINPHFFNFAPLQLPVAPGLYNHRIFSWFNFSVIFAQSGGASTAFTNASGFLVGNIDVWKYGRNVGRIPVNLYVPCEPRNPNNFTTPLYLAGSTPTFSFAQITNIGGGITNIGFSPQKGMIGVTRPTRPGFASSSVMLPYIEVRGDCDAFTVSISGLYSSLLLFVQGYGYGNLFGNFYCGILSSNEHQSRH